MIEELSKKVAGCFVRGGQIGEEEIDLYALGVEVVLSTFATSAAILFMGLLFHNFAGAIVFLLCFIQIRNYSGGFHASTRWRCFFTSLSCYAISYLSVVGMGKLPERWRGVAVGVVVLSAIIIFVALAPVENKNKKLPPDWKKRNRVRAFFSLGIWLLLALGSLCYWKEIGWQIIATIGTIAVLIL